VASAHHFPVSRGWTKLASDYYVTDGFTFNNDLVIRRDRRASLCWGRHVDNRSGRVTFLISAPTIEALLSPSRFDTACAEPGV